MFKGGNTFRIVIKELIRNFEAKTEKYITSLIENVLKLVILISKLFTIFLIMVNKINNISYVLRITITKLLNRK